MRAQQEVGFIEKFATSSDRRTALKELIPGTEDYYYYHCLHFQNEKQLPQAQAALDQWKAKFGETAGVARMQARQMVLAYDQNPNATIQFLREKLGVQLDHAPPSRDRAAALASAIEAGQLDPDRLVEAALQRDRSFGQIATLTLPKLVDQQMAPDQLRAWLQRLDRADFNGLVKRVAEELALQDSPGFGWAPVHNLLTLAQLDELLKLRPSLNGHEPFLRTYLARLAPPEYTPVDDAAQQRVYLERLARFVRSLPPSQNSLKAMVIGNLLRLNLKEGKYDRNLFLEYLALPRQAPYYAMERIRNQPVTLADLNFAMNPQVILPPVGNDVPLVRSYLEHFFQSENKVDDFARYLDRDYLERVLAETKILYGDDDAATWYAKLSPAEQKAVRERIELRFGPSNKTHFAADDEAKLAVDVKNVSKLLVKIYEVNPRNYYRSNNQPISTSVELDGLVANSQRQIEYSQPADRRHSETIALPELKGRGVWIVDLLGGGQRSRALIQKGTLSSVQKLTDLGHELQVFDERGQLVKSARAELGDRAFESDSEGRILIPYVESAKSQNVILVDGDFASQETLLLQNESYALGAKFIVDRQALVSGTIASVLVRAQLTCTGRPASIKLLENPQLTITAVDLDGLPTTQTIGNLKLSDSGELVHKFLVPQRLSTIDFRLSGRVYNESRDERQEIASSETLALNENLRTTLIGSFYLQPSDKGYRLLVLGRNGEPLPKLPVTLAINTLDVASIEYLTLATDAKGEIGLGELPRVTTLNVSAQGVQPRTFQLELPTHAWPPVVHQSTKDKLTLPLGEQSVPAEQLSLLEFNRGVIQRSLNDSLKINEGTVEVQALPAGSYQLRDHRSGQIVSIAVVEPLGDASNYLIGSTRSLEPSQIQPVAIKKADVAEKDIRIDVSGADKHTRVHIIAHPLWPDLAPAAQARLPYPPLMLQARRRSTSFYVDSLQLDEEYSYILQRQQATHYPGNLLAQPSLLVHPWEISLTDNQKKDAADGDPMARLAEPAAPPAAAAPMDARQMIAPALGSVSYDFLSQGTLVAANLKVDDKGQVVVPRGPLAGYTSVTILVVHPTTTDARYVVLPPEELKKRDLRLKSAFEADKHLAETQTVRQLEPGAKMVIGDARTSRVQVYSTLGDVYRLYSSILGQNPEWEKFRFVTRWDQLSDDEKRAKYSEMSCHELDYFLYRKDRKFFDAVVAPLVAQKLDKQLIDLWLLGKPIEAYSALWRVQRLNALERILLAARLEQAAPGTQRWLDEFVAAFPMNPVARSQRFEIALRGSVLDGGPVLLGLEMAEAESLRQNMHFDAPASMDFSMGETMQNGSLGGAGGMPGGMGGMGGATTERFGLNALEDAVKEKAAEADKPERADAFFGGRGAHLGKRALARRDRFFQTLDQTREWAETQYHRIRLDNQTPELIPPGPFWQEFARHTGEGKFLSQSLDLPVSNINEALLALAVIDLPWQAEPVDMNVENNQLVITSKLPAVAYVQSIEEAAAAEGAPSILVGEDIYLAEPHTDEESNKPLQDKPLLIGVPYRSSVVVTNPTSAQKRVHVLNQLPAGAIPLAASRVTRSTPVELNPYSTAQVQTIFYFPAAGEFDHYGSQISSEGKHLVHTESEKLKVLAEPESVDETTWSYIADWGSNEAVLKYLAKANLQRLDLGRIAFRMQDKAFYSEVLRLLSQSGRFDPVLWAYSLLHQDAVNIAQYLQNRRDFTDQLGPAIASSLITLDPREQMTYEHLEYKPLVVARIHQLGSKRLVLNDKLFAQYSKLLTVMAHQAKVSHDERMELCYYSLIQNRIDEALKWFEQVEADQLATRIQYDYFDAYLDFFRGNYEHAAQVAGQYASYPVPRWRNLFGEIGDQIRQRDALLSGQELTSVTSLDSGMERADRMLTDRREAQQNRQAAEAPGLDLHVADGVVTVHHRNLDEVRVNYYLMDIELLFSRSPFAAETGNRLPPIRPNVTETLKVAAGQGAAMKLELPDAVRNRNVLVEVTAKGISRIGLVTANTLAVTVVEAYGRVQVRSQTDRAPVEAAYVKVYARHQDGSIRFFKDGYTDLRGQFDYATLSTGDLSTTSGLAILVIDPKHGALVREAAPPTR